MIKKIFPLIACSTLALSFQEKPSFLKNEAKVNIEKFYKDKKVLVTGGCGFIGSYIVEKLVALGARVSIIDDLSTGNLKNIESIKHQITFFEKSIVDQANCDQAVADNEIIFHLAAYTSVPGSIADPTRCHAVNVDGTFFLLNAARKHKIKRFVLSSTSAAYGPRESACVETDAPNPISPYGATKLMGELYCKQFMLNFNVPCVMLRYFNVYGERQDPNSQYAAVVAKFTQLMAENKPVTIFGDGSQTRDFVAVEQVVEANLIAGMADEKLVNGNVYNIGSAQAISVLDLAHALKKQYPGYEHEPIFAPARDGDVMHTLSDCNKFKQLCSELNS